MTVSVKMILMMALARDSTLCAVISSKATCDNFLIFLFLIIVMINNQGELINKSNTGLHLHFWDVLKHFLSVYIRIFVPSGSQPILGDPVRHHIVGCQNILRDLMGPHKLLRDLLVYDDCESLKVQVEYINAYLLLCVNVPVSVFVFNFLCVSCLRLSVSLRIFVFDF